MKVNIKSLTAKVVTSTTTKVKDATDAVSTKVQVVRDAHVVKTTMTDEEKAQAKIQEQMFRNVQVALLNKKAEEIRRARQAKKDALKGEQFATTYMEAVENFVSTTS